jgi:hypothetical protein
MILGLDISTATIGHCCLNDDGSFVSIGYLNLKKEKNFYKKLDIFCDFVKKIDTTSNIEIFVEEPVKAFKTNFSMAQTISKLTAFNSACCYILYSLLKVEPKTVMASSARKTVGISVHRGENVKQVVLQFVQDCAIIPIETWKMKKTGKPKDFCFDMADAYVVAAWGIKKDGQ